MVSSYPLPEGFSEFDVFSLGSCLLVEGECFHFVLELSQMLRVYEGLHPLCYINLRRDLTLPRSLTVQARILWEERSAHFSSNSQTSLMRKQKNKCDV